MALQVWLPLTKDTRNQGLLTLPTPWDVRSRDTGGKLGQYCYSDNAIYHIENEWLGNEWSLACWVKSSSWSQYNDIMLCKNTTDSTVAQFYLSIIGGTQLNIGCNAGSSLTVNYTFATNTWYHIAATYSGTTLKLYLNGSEVGTKAYTSTQKTGMNNLGIGCRSTNAAGTSATGGASKRMNDVRIYDHCLSPMEVKKLSQGLVLHYPLNRQGLGPSNLIKNGFGELGAENWTNSSNISTTDIPSGQSDIKISVTNNYTIERIKIYPTHTYKFSAWIKATTTSGNTYPSLFPYDVDGKFIDYYKCSDGFNLNTMTTLKQQLKTGDTKIYVNDLSQWNANSGHYYNWAAIFSYTDSTGYTYPDGTYTQNLGRFGTSTNAKTNLDKTNNIITLTTAYTGPTMPVGTKLCASTEGSTYYYPLNGINLANIQDWTYKEGTFSASTARLKYATEVMFWTYTNNRMAGIKLQDLTNENLDTTTEYDCSGFCNNGTRTSTFTWTSNTPKYAVSQVFNGTDNAIQTPSLPTMITDKNYTIAVWIYKTVIGSKSYQTIYGGPSGFEIEARNGGANETKFVPWNWGKPMASYELNEWNHCVFVHSDADCKIYLNGEYIATGTAKASNPTGDYFIGAWNTATQQNFDGLMSDFRIYATALSADDVKSLYQNCATIDPDGTIRGKIR